MMDVPSHGQNVKTHLDDHGISVFDGPGNSPDLNPIECLWKDM